jgi:hypothetical protein
VNIIDNGIIDANAKRGNALTIINDKSIKNAAARQEKMGVFLAFNKIPTIKSTTVSSKNQIKVA